MAIRLNEINDGKILEVHVSGKLTHRDYQRFMPEFERMICAHGKIRILFEMEEFRGWKMAALWDDIKVDVRHLSAIDRLAMIGDRRWQRWMSNFCRPFTTAEIRYFDRAAADEARSWIGDETAVDFGEHGSILRVFQSREQTRKYYNKISHFYDLLSERSEAPMRRAGLGTLDARAGESILEIGFGTGHIVAALARAVGPGGTVFGIDLSDQMVRVAKQNLDDAELLERIRLRCGDAVQLPYASESMDAVFMSFTLELFDTPEIPVVLNECRRVLRTGGRIVVVGMSKKGNREPLLGLYEWAHKHLPNFIDCRPIYVRKSLEHAGFKIQKSLIRHMWVPVEIILGTKPSSKPEAKNLNVDSAT
jgi:ubiquinone/menaquinone biosynthesis C-methylase UbiE